jgi:hypothetical protein
MSHGIFLFLPTSAGSRFAGAAFDIRTQARHTSVSGADTRSRV